MQTADSGHFIHISVDSIELFCYNEYVGRPLGCLFLYGGMLMIQELVHDPFLLARKSVPAEKAHLPIAQDLLDTLAAHRETCVGQKA